MSAQLEQMESSPALAPAQRAAIALDSAKHRKELVELVKKSAGIVTVLNADGREEAHRAGMVLKNTRVAIQKRGKEAREDATAFSKAVIAEEKALIDMISPEEERVLALRDEWDAKVEAERQAKIEAERRRVEEIQARIAEIRGIPVIAAGKSSEVISRLIASLVDDVPDASFQEFEETAKAVRLEILDKLATMETEQRGIEIQQEAERLEAERRRIAQEEEAARLKAEREELDRLRAEQEARTAEERRKLQAEQEEAAAKARAEQEAAQAALQAERDRMNAELAAERERLAKEQAALDAERSAAEAAKRETEKRELLEQQARAFLESAKSAPAAEWAWSFNEESYHGREPTIEVAIAEALAEAGDEYGRFWVGKCERFAGAGNADLVVEHLQEQCYEECGEFGEGYLEDVTKEELKELADFITAWAARVDRSNFYTITQAQEFTVDQARELIAQQPEAAAA